MYKIITCDLDETLLCMDRSVCKRNIDAIHAAKEKGVKFVCASGRGYMSFQNTLQEIGLYDCPDQYSISFNGGVITENKGNRILYLEGISWELADTLYRKGTGYDVCIHVYTRDKVYIYNLNEDETAFLNNRMEFIEIFDKDLSFLKGEQIMKVLYQHVGYDYLYPIEKELSSLTGDCEVSYSSGRYLEFNKKGVSKGDGLRRLAQILGVDMKDTLAIGDNVNDLPMIQAAGLGAAVGNVFEGIRSKCGYIAESNNDEGGVGEIIEKFVLSAVPEAAEADKRQGEYTLDDYYALPDERRVELIDGVIYDMAAPSMLHQRILGDLFILFRECMDRHEGNCEVYLSPCDVRLDRDNRTMVQPDLFVICREYDIDAKRYEGPPDLTLEILSPSTRSKDMLLKLYKYANAGVREYWIVDPDQKTVLVYDLEHDNYYPGRYSFEAEIPIMISGGECSINFSRILRRR